MLPFVKMHGAGNDYVYLDAVADPALADRDDLPGLARAIGNRHTGVGSDGLILVCLPTQAGRADGAHARMRMFNADGSEGAMCGNGVRCVAKFAHDRLGIRDNPVRIETGRGVLGITCTLDDAGRVASATVDMDRPILDAASIPVQLPRPPAGGRVVEVDATTLIPMSGSAMEDGGVAPGMTCVSMGNPHAVLFCRSVDTVPLEALGPHIARQPIFPSGVNVHFAQVVSPDRLRVRTWERGSGATLACGTGACAVLVAAALTGRARREGAVDLPGGTLHVRWDRATDHVFLTGPAADVCTGHWPLSAPTPLTPIPTLTTDRLTLRSLTQDDAAAVAALAADKRISDTTLTVPYPYLPHHASSWISTHAAGHSAGFNTVWGILDRRTGHVVGTVGIVCNTRHNTAEIGYWIGVPFWNRGYASEAAGAVLRWAFTQREPALQRIDAHHFIGNEASGRVMAKMGMLYEGLCLAAARKQGKAVDVARYAITREQWLGRSARADGVPAAKTSRQ